MTKKLFSFSLLFLLVSLTVLNSSAQDRNKDFKELNELRTNFYKSLKGKSYRTITETELFDNVSGVFRAKYTIISETQPPDRGRQLFKFESADGIVKVTETIFVGDEIYTRENNGEWQIPKNKVRTGSGGGGGTSEVKFIEETMLEGKKVKVFEEKSRRFSDFGDYETTARYYFDQEGSLLRIESDELNLKSNERSKRIVRYELDSNISIEAPIK